MKASDELKNSIVEALKEERQPKSLRHLKTIILSIALTLGFLVVFFKLWPADFNSAVIAVGLSLFIVFASGFVLYFYPQPRISIPGFWMPWMWGRLLIFTGIASTLQLILCPDLAGVFGVESFLPWLTSITHIFMNIGGMKACMIACGILFSGISASIVLLSLKRVLSHSRAKWIAVAAFFVFIGQAPVIICQIMNQANYLSYWIIGSVMSITASALIIRLISNNVLEDNKAS